MTAQELRDSKDIAADPELYVALAHLTIQILHKKGHRAATVSVDKLSEQEAQEVINYLTAEGYTADYSRSGSWTVRNPVINVSW
jgi:hypothetical protein